MRDYQPNCRAISRGAKAPCIVLTCFSLLGCQSHRVAGAAPDDPGVAQPTATEIFDLRTKCSELGDKILRLNPVDRSLSSEQNSHYDVKTNRCYVLHFVHSGSFDYMSEEVFDGQSRELMVSIERRGGKVTTFINGGFIDASESDARAKMKSLMGDDRKQ